MTAPKPQTIQTNSLPYVLPFAVFGIFLIAAPYLTFLGVWEYPLRVVLLSLVLAVFSRHVTDFRTRSPLSSVVFGVIVFLLWVAPDVLFPGYRGHWVFNNP